MKKVLTGRSTTIFLFAAIILVGYFLYPQLVQAIGECSEYGAMARYNSLDNSCECMSGYVFDDDAIGGTRCVSGDSVCQDRLGYGAEYDSYSNSCQCSYGYVMGENIIGKRECISEDRACKNQLGPHSRATYGGDCECSAGYVIDGGECEYGDSVCRDRHGRNSSYDSISNSCECDDDYTLDEDGQCVEKENNVYFQLLDIDTSNDEVIVRSDYDSQQYLLEYGFGCYDFSFESYEGDNIVINLGTDYDVDWGDMIVLQNDDETCDIQGVEWTSEDSFEDDESEEDTQLIDHTLFNERNQQQSESSRTSENEVRAEVSEQQAQPFQYKTDVTTLDNLRELVVNTRSNIRECPSTTRCSVKSTLDSDMEVMASQSYENWLKITSGNMEGWISASLVSTSSEKSQSQREESSKKSTTTEESGTTSATAKQDEVDDSSQLNFWQRIQDFFLSVF